MAYKQISPQPVVEGGTGAATLTGVLTGNGTSAVTANAVTQYAVLVGGASNAVGNVASVGSSGQVLTSNGAGSNPTFQDNASGDVSGPGSSTDNALARWNGTGGDTLQDSTVIVTDNGEMTNSSQPAFLVYVNTTITNVTGDNTQYTIVFDTEVYDQNADFSSTTFTAPVTGKYRFDAGVGLINGTSMTNVQFRFNTSNNLFRIPIFSSSGLTSAGMAGSVLADMDAADTCTIITLASDTGGVIDDVAGVTSGSIRTYFSGNLVC